MLLQGIVLVRPALGAWVERLGQPAEPAVGLKELLLFGRRLAPLCLDFLQDADGGKIALEYGVLAARRRHVGVVVDGRKIDQRLSASVRISRMLALIWFASCTASRNVRLLPAIRFCSSFSYI